jgi:hypothetical protein
MGPVGLQDIVCEWLIGALDLRALRALQVQTTRLAAVSIFIDQRVAGSNLSGSICIDWWTRSDLN